MTHLAKNLMCICVYGDIELWLEEDRAEKLMQMVEEKKNNHSGPDLAKIEINGRRQFVSLNSIIGAFTPDVMEARTRRKNGQWQCNYGKWHEKGDEGRQEHYWCKKDAEKHGSSSH